MMDQSAIQHIEENAAAVALNGELLHTLFSSEGSVPVTALPKDFNLHSMEKYLPHRVRYRAQFVTSHPTSFANYHDQRGMEAPVFVDRDRMKAVAIYNLHSGESAGHGDDTATLQLEKTAAFKDYEQFTSSGQHSQRSIAEWVEDWRDFITAIDTEGDSIPMARLIATLRNIDIESARKVNSSEGDFSATRSALESIEAKSSAGSMPKVLIFTCNPYHGLPDQEFRFRIGILTSGDKLTFSARRIQEEGDTEATAEKFCETLRAWLPANADIYQGVISL